MVTFDRGHPGPNVIAYVRLDRQAPRRRSGAPLVRLSFDDPQHPLEIKPLNTAGRKARACYGAKFFDGPVHPRTGMRMKLVLDIGPRNRYTRKRITGRLQGVDLSSHPIDNPVLKDLGCVNGR